MTIERETRQSHVTHVFVAGGTCDRCGQDLRHLVGSVPEGFPFEGVMLRGRLYPSGNLSHVETLDAELCGGCLTNLVDWVAAGRGRAVGAGVRRAHPNAK